MTETLLNYHELRCLEHSNPIQRICLHDSCQNRILCLLCQTHLHGKEFLSILDKPTQSYKRFCDKITEQIDNYLLQVQTSQSSLLRFKQKQALQGYFKQLKNRLDLFLDDRQKQIAKMLSSGNQKLVQDLKNARIAKDFVHLNQSLFNICFRAYEGEKVSQILQGNQLLKSQEAYQKLNQFHEQIQRLMQKFQFSIKIRIPQIKNKTQFLENKQQLYNNFKSQYEADYTKNNKATYNLMAETDAFDSIISSSIKTATEEILSVSYDKKLRVYKRSYRTTPSIDLLMQKQYSNILTKIQLIGENMYAIGQSKQLLIEKISQQTKDQWQSKNIMKLLGHQERIVDIASYNTRIIGSSSHQGTKIWDLYKERCEYTFKQNYNPSALIFLPKINNLVIGYNNHLAKVYSIEKLKNIRKIQLSGLPLIFTQQKLDQNTFYVGSFSSHLSVLDVRLNKLSFSFDFKEDAVSYLSQMLNQQNKVMVGFRNGAVKIFDTKMRKIQSQIQAQVICSKLSKPNGIVGVYEQGEKQIITVCCNERKLKLWQISIGDSK